MSERETGDLSAHEEAAIRAYMVRRGAVRPPSDILRSALALESDSRVTRQRPARHWPFPGRFGGLRTALGSLAAVGIVAVAVLLVVRALPPPGPVAPVSIVPSISLPTPTVSVSQSAPSASPSPTVSARPDPTPVLRTPTPGVVGEWAQLTATGLGEVYSLSSMAFADGVYVAAGDTLSAGLDPSIWYSTDALHWEQANLSEPAGDRIVQVVSGGPGFVAIALQFGARGDGGWTTSRVFASGDGRDWVLATSFDGEVKRVGAIGSRLVAFGIDDDRRPKTWISDDAATWSNPIDGSAATIAEGVIGLYHDEGMWLWAIRSNHPGEDGTNVDPVELWRTADGEHWVNVTDLPRSESATDAWMTAGPAGWVVTALRVTFPGGAPGGPGVREWSAWHSRDGVEWKRADSAPKHTDYILADAHGFVAAGGDYGGCCAPDAAYVQGTLWVSADGMSWRQWPNRGWFGRVIEGLTLVGDTVVGIGVDWSDPDVGLGVVWTIDRSKLSAAAD